MDEYVWISDRAHETIDSVRVHPILNRLAEKHGAHIIPVAVGDPGKEWAAAVREAVDRKVSGIMLAYPDSPDAAAAAEVATDAGVPVVVIEGSIPSPHPIVSVGADWFRIGAVMAERTAELIGEAGRIIVAADPGPTPRIYAGLAGYQYHTRRYPKITVAAGKGSGGNEPVPAEKIQDRLRHRRNIAAVIAFGTGSALAAVAAAEEKKPKRPIPILAAGDDLSLVGLVQSGKIDVLCTPRIELSAAVAFNLLRAESRDALLQGIDTGFAVVTTDTAPEFIREAERWKAGDLPDITRLLWGRSVSESGRPGAEEEMRNRAILDAIPDLIFQIDRAGRFISYKADRREELYVPPDRFLGKTVDEVLPAYLAKLTKDRIEKVLSSGHIESYEYVLEFGGELRQYEARMAATGADQFIVIIRDITERNRAEEALRESEERFRVAFKTSPDAMAITRIEDGLFLDINDGFMQITGYTRDEIVGKTVFDVDIWYDPRDRDRLTAGLRERGYITNLEAKFRLKGDRVHTGLISARIIQLHGVGYMLSVTRDIEERIQAEAALRESEERFRAVFETAQDAIYIKDRDRQYVAVNPSFARLRGIPAADFVGKQYEDIFGYVNAELNRQREERVLGGDVVNEESVRIIDGRERIFHVVMVPMRVDGGEIIGLCGIAREITETKLLQESAERARRLEMAGTIAGQVAHDFNNLLGPLMAYPGIIRESVPPDSAINQYLDDIEQAAGQMADINQQLLTLGRRGHYSRGIFNLNEIIGYVLQHMPPPTTSISVSTELAGDLMNISGGASQIYRVISNLVNNAYDAMPEGGRLLCRTENIYIDKIAGKFGRIPIGEFVKITISDNGSGIPADILPRIFDPFYTTKTTDRKRGSGLGLSVVHAVVEDHEGFVDVESSPGKGTAFYVYFPVTREEVHLADSTEVVGGSEHILVVDDDRIQLDVASAMLSRLGYTVRGAESGAEALTLLREDDYDLLLLDMVMPSGVDGAELYRRALNIRPQQPAIMMSGFAESERVKRALALGAGQFLKKPLTLAALAAAVRAELDKTVRR